MIRYQFRLALWFTGFLLLPIALIRTQPYDDSELRAFLTPPDGCPAPCFMGIRPRITSVENAIPLLRAHDWVQSLDNETISLGNTTRYPAHLNWQWSGRQPALIDPDGNRELWIFSGNITSVDIDTQITVGDLKLGLSKPDTEKFERRTVATRCSFVYTAWYQQFHLTIIATGACPLGNIYKNKVSLHWRHTG